MFIKARGPGGGGKRCEPKHYWEGQKLGDFFKSDYYQGSLHAYPEKFAWNKFGNVV